MQVGWYTLGSGFNMPKRRIRSCTYTSVADMACSPIKPGIECACMPPRHAVVNVCQILPTSSGVFICSYGDVYVRMTAFLVTRAVSDLHRKRGQVGRGENAVAAGFIMLLSSPYGVVGVVLINDWVAYMLCDILCWICLMGSSRCLTEGCDDHWDMSGHTHASTAAMSSAFKTSHVASNWFALHELWHNMFLRSFLIKF